MVKDEYYVIGVMSGTSLDGVDVAYLHFKYANTWTYDIIYGETIAYSPAWEQKLREAINYKTSELETLDVNYTVFLAEVIQDFIAKFKLEKIDAVCSHGHTILHQPEHGITFQMGNLKKLSEVLQQTVVCDFRVQDVELGGQGAPLVPIGDELLFSEFTYCLNLGGFSNISTNDGNKRIAYDVCPVNIVLNHYMQQLGKSYDDGGQIASSGQVDVNLLKELNALEFYQMNFPKSLGLEWVKATIFPLIDKSKLPVADILRTFVEHCAIQISKQFVSKGKVLITGGGMYNSFLIDRIQSLSEHTIHMPDSKLIEFKEALIFGFLGVLKLRGDVNVLASVTGAQKNHSSGVVYFANNSN
ncbi:MAG: anhydro-N-acetylmuramic acid kinase [Flavobacteriaceae bacterium]